MISTRQAITIALRNFQLDPCSRVHGIPHWLEVWKNAQQLMRAFELAGEPFSEAEWDTVLLFAFMHDCQRANDNEDPAHGARAAGWLKLYFDNGTFQLPAVNQEQLMQAMIHHSAGKTGGHRVVQVCWDADRLDLGRVGILPMPRLMCTAAGKMMARDLRRIK